MARLPAILPASLFLIIVIHFEAFKSFNNAALLFGRAVLNGVVMVS